MNWLWPKLIRAETNTSIRVGRVLHWIGLLIGCAIAAFCMVGIVADGLSGPGVVSGSAFFFSVAAAFVLGGRALRYILADE